MVSTIDEARTPAELAEWLRVWADSYEEGVDYLDDNDARQIADAVERVCAPCNAAALREALEAMLDECCNLCDVPNQMSESGHTCSWRNRWSGCQSKAIDKAIAALAAPARNCDVGDASEQSERLAKFCKANYEKAKKDKHICSECQFNDCIGECPLKWAQMPFAPAEGGAE